MASFAVGEEREQLILELKDFAQAHIASRSGAEDEYWFAQTELPSHDFNREISKPGEIVVIPNGCVRMMCDGDFYEVANLPYRFVALSCTDIVTGLWPQIPNPTIYPDHGDYWWTAIHNENIEVPGEPVELWFHRRQNEQITESLRLETFASEAEALAREALIKSHASDDTEALFEIRIWRDAVRQTGELRPRTNVIYSPPSKPAILP